MPDPIPSDEVQPVGREMADSVWSRRAVLLGAGVGAAGVALSDAPEALARLVGRGGADAQEVVNVAATIEC